MTPDIAYIARGVLHVRSATGGPAKALESPFAESIRTRATRIHERNAWKTRGSSALFQRGGAPWGAPKFDPTRIRIRLDGICRGRKSGEILYALQTDDVGGLFAQDPVTGEEKRLFHSASLHVRQPATRSDGALIVCSVGSDGGASHLVVMSGDGSEVREVTEGDCVDLAPRWVPGNPRCVVYPSAGLSRAANGIPMGTGPFAIQQLDLKSGEITTLVEDEKYDHLAPQMSADQSLYFIRRPRTTARPNPFRTLLGIVLMPVQLLWAIFQWVNFFTIRYSGKPLINDGDTRQQAADLQRMMVWGNMIDADAETKRGFRRGEEAPALVPRSWELVRRSPAGETTVVARGVLSFDLAEDGSVVYSNGTGVFVVDPHGRETRVCVEKQVEQVAFLG
jgi:hypothetical protein